MFGMSWKRIIIGIVAIVIIMKAPSTGAHIINGAVGLATDFFNGAVEMISKIG